MDNKREITEITRRNIADAFVIGSINWAGRLEEQQLLARIYDLSKLPSHDSRYSNAMRDIAQHRTYNKDWDNDWVFYDSRFNLLNVSDEELLRFLCEIIHPVVQPDAAVVEEILSALNEQLSKDGWEIREGAQISGRPVFAASRLLEFSNHSVDAAKIIPSTGGADYISKQITRMQSSLRSDPDVAIGTAKEFVETVCKTILRERDIPCDSNPTMPRLAKQVASALDLIPKEIENHSKAAETVKRLISNLGTVSDSIAELRNLHGTGHGKDAISQGLDPRHARLAVGSATTLAVFLWESHTAATN